jgi:GT2 family glycosyltransferase
MTNDRPFISVIVCTLNRSAHLFRTLSYFVDQEDYTPFEVIVVDQSDELSPTLAKLIEANPDRFRLTRRDQKSLPKSRNAGIRLAKGSILVFVDDDVEILPGFLNAHSVALSDAAIWGSTGPVFVPGDSRDLVSAHLLPPIELHQISACRVNRWDLDFAYEPTYLCGCNMAIRRDALEKIGLFNEVLEIHCDDAEISSRIRWNGGSLLYTPQARLIHHRVPEGGTRDDPIRSPEYVRKYARSSFFWARETQIDPLRAIWRLARVFIFCRRPLAIRQFIGLCQGLIEGHRDYVRQGRPGPSTVSANAMNRIHSAKLK